MIYADTDFFIALVKDDDWLQERAATIATEDKGIIYRRDRPSASGSYGRLCLP